MTNNKETCVMYPPTCEYKVTMPVDCPITTTQIITYLKDAIYCKYVSHTPNIPFGYEVGFKDGNNHNIVPSNLVLIKCGC